MSTLTTPKRTPTVIAPSGPVPTAMLPRRLVALTGVLLAVSSAAGLLVDGLYDETEAVVAMFRGYDLVCLVVAVPLLGAALLPRFRASSRAALLRAGLLAFIAYDYAYYVFGMSFNELFLLHVATFVAAVGALATTLAAVQVPTLGAPPRSGRIAAVILGLLAASLAYLWISGALNFALTGEMPDDGNLLVSTIAITHLGYAMDLVFLVPAYIAGAVLLWRRRPWGTVLAVVVLVAGAVTQLTYMGAIWFQDRAEVAGAAAFDPFGPMLFVIYAIGAGLLLASVRSQRDVVVLP